MERPLRIRQGTAQLAVVPFLADKDCVAIRLVLVQQSGRLQSPDDVRRDAPVHQVGIHPAVRSWCSLRHTDLHGRCPADIGAALGRGIRSADGYMASVQRIDCINEAISKVLYQKVDRIPVIPA